MTKEEFYKEACELLHHSDNTVTISLTAVSGEYALFILNHETNESMNIATYRDGEADMLPDARKFVGLEPKKEGE